MLGSPYFGKLAYWIVGLGSMVSLVLRHEVLTTLRLARLCFAWDLAWTLDPCSPPQVDRIWLWVYYIKIPIYPILYLLRGIMNVWDS